LMPSMKGRNHFLNSWLASLGPCCGCYTAVSLRGCAATLKLPFHRIPLRSTRVFALVPKSRVSETKATIQGSHQFADRDLLSPPPSKKCSLRAASSPIRTETLGYRSQSRCQSLVSFSGTRGKAKKLRLTAQNVSPLQKLFYQKGAV
jgi:hypothetical protein